MWNTLEAFAEGIRAEHRIPGTAIAVAQGGKTVYAKGLGHRDSERGVPVTPGTIFGIGSITKSMTAIALLQLEEAGRLRIDDPVARYLPEFRVPGVTLHHFLTHTSGLPPLPCLGWAMESSQRGDPAAPPAGKPHPRLDTYADLLDYLAHGDFDLLGRPGEYISYSNDAYGLLGCVIERVTGRPYAEVVAERIFEPCGMETATFALERVLAAPDATTLYARKPGTEEVFAAPAWQEAPPYVAAGFARCSAEDLLRYAQMLLAGGRAMIGAQILPEAAFRRMVAPLHRSGRDQWYGYGLMLRPGYGPGVALVEHSGGLKGVSAQMGFVPERGIAAVVLSNLAGVPSGKIWLGAINALLDLPLDTPRSVEPQYSPAPGELEGLAGRYRSGEGVDVEVSVKDGALAVRTEGDPIAVRPSGPDTLAVTMRGIENGGRILRDPAGRVWALQLGLRVVRREPDFIDLTRYACARMRARLLATLEQMSDEDVAWRPGPGSNSAANLVLHICGNASQRIGARIGGAPDVRDRENEFRVGQAVARDDLAQLVRRSFDEADRALAGMAPARLQETQDYDGEPVTHRDMLLQAIAHFEEHTGQVISLGKQRAGSRWRELPWGWGRTTQRV